MEKRLHKAKLVWFFFFLVLVGKIEDVGKVESIGEIIKVSIGSCSLVIVIMKKI